MEPPGWPEPGIHLRRTESQNPKIFCSGGRNHSSGPNFPSGLPEARGGPGISRHFGLELEKLSPGQARVGMNCRPEMANILGMVHGTTIFALINEAFQAAGNAHGTVAVALTMNLTFHAAPRMGERLTAQTGNSTPGGAPSPTSSKSPTPGGAWWPPARRWPTARSSRCLWGVPRVRSWILVFNKK